jgi:DNA-binding MarR family transcriptional regulator
MNREKDIGFNIRRLFNLIRRDVEKSRDKIGIDSTENVNGWAIGYLYENRDKDIFQKDFENEFSIRPPTASKLLKTMEQKGFIERISVENDARLKKITLTKKAIDIHERIIADIKNRELRLRKGISEEEIDNFLITLKKLTLNLEAEND